MPKKGSFYQDRLGTNRSIREALKRRTLYRFLPAGTFKNLASQPELLGRCSPVQRQLLGAIADGEVRKTDPTLRHAI